MGFFHFIFLLTLFIFLSIVGAENKIICENCTTVSCHPIIGYHRPLYNKTNNKLTTRIVNGKIARPHQFPYQVSLKSQIVPDKLSTWCGGSLISEEYVLSAAHCFLTYWYELLPNKSIDVHYDKRAWVYYTTVFLGAHDLNSPSRDQIQFEMHVKSVTIHPNYDSYKLHNDIALLKLPEHVKLSDKIQVISLPPRNLPSLIGKSLIASGWGVINWKTGEDSSILRYTEVPVISYEVCNKKLISVKDDLHICAQDINGSGTCTGDSGGPNVLQKEDGTKILVGITSFHGAEGCDLAPHGLTRVTHYLDWISSVTGIQIKDE